jgi:hypothetical protein
MNSADATLTTGPWNILLESGSLRILRSEIRWGRDFHYQARIEQQESDGSWRKIGLLDSNIHIDWPNYWPKEEVTRIFFADCCAAVIETQKDQRTLLIDGFGQWRFDETTATRVLGLESGLPAIRLETVPGVYWAGGPIVTVQDDASGVEIARFREIRPRLFQSFEPSEVFAHPAMRPLVGAVALRQCVIDSLGRAGWIG